MRALEVLLVLATSALVIGGVVPPVVLAAAGLLLLVLPDLDARLQVRRRLGWRHEDVVAP